MGSNISKDSIDSYNSKPQPVTCLYEMPDCFSYYTTYYIIALTSSVSNLGQNSLTKDQRYFSRGFC